MLLDVLEYYVEARGQHHNDENQKVFDNERMHEFFCAIFRPFWLRTLCDTYLSPEMTYLQNMDGQFIFFH